MEVDFSSTVQNLQTVFGFLKIIGLCFVLVSLGWLVLSLVTNRPVKSDDGD